MQLLLSKVQSQPLHFPTRGLKKFTSHGPFYHFLCPSWKKRPGNFQPPTRTNRKRSDCLWTDGKAHNIWRQSQKNHYEWINFIWNTQDENKCWMKKGNNVASKRMPRAFMKPSSVFRYHNICRKMAFCFPHNGLSLNILRNMRYDYHNRLEK